MISRGIFEFEKKEREREKRNRKESLESLFQSPGRIKNGSQNKRLPKSLSTETKIHFSFSPVQFFCKSLTQLRTTPFRYISPIPSPLARGVQTPVPRLHRFEFNRP